MPSTEDGVEQLVTISERLIELSNILKKAEEKKETYDEAVVMAVRVQLDFLDEDVKGSKLPDGFIAVKQKLRDDVSKWLIHLAKKSGLPPKFNLVANIRALIEELSALIATLES